jgi:2-polyprenyl-3-methyl-5-hydroxy-6-metoxy-1,4-benzoquinol methylase
VADAPGLSAHWDAAYARGPEAVSWFQEQAAVSLRLIDGLGLAAEAPVIDVGGGASPLAGALLDRGLRDITVLDISAHALSAARDRLGPRAAAVTWLQADLRTFTPARRYALWHDRAVLHFLTDPEDRRGYARCVADAVAPGGHAILATFALDGPERCSGLAVQRYDAAGLAALLGDRFDLVADEREQHRTPGGATQRFTWIVARRR